MCLKIAHPIRAVAPACHQIQLAVLSGEPDLNAVRTAGSTAGGREVQKRVAGTPPGPRLRPGRHTVPRPMRPRHITVQRYITVQRSSGGRPELAWRAVILPLDPWPSW